MRGLHHEYPTGISRACHKTSSHFPNRPRHISADGRVGLFRYYLLKLVAMRLHRKSSSPAHNKEQ
jgi:hypothetical protein